MVGVGRRKERLDNLSGKFGRSFLGVRLDVTDAAQVWRTFESLPDAFRDIDILVNNAGLALDMSPAYKCLLDDWERMVATNISGLLNVTNCILPKMVARNAGHIVNMGSIAGEFPYPGGNVYGATKAFVKQFGRNLRADLLGTAIRVTNLEPGLCDGTEFSEVRFNGDLKKASSVYDWCSPHLNRSLCVTA